MPAPERLLVWKLLLAAALLLLPASSALAYVGPGADLTLVGSFFSLLAWVGVVLSATLMWPIYALLRRLRGQRRQGEQVPAGPPAGQGGEGPPGE
jgi:hypothetical protein